MRTSDTPSRQVLDLLPGRVITFLTALGTVVELRAILASAGYEDADHQEGWDLFHEATGFKRSTPQAPTMTLDPEVRAAIAELDAADEPTFRLAHAALARRHPVQDAFVFGGDLAAATGAGAVASMQLFTDRLNALERGKDRTATRKEDKAALKTLEKRGITPEARRRWRDLLKTAVRGMKKVAPATPPPDPEKAPAAGEARYDALGRLYAWFVEWSETAHAKIRRRDYLIRLGLAKRQKRAQAPAAPAGAAPPAA